MSERASRYWSVLGVLIILIVTTAIIWTTPSLYSAPSDDGENTGIITARSSLATTAQPDYEPFSVLVCKRDPYIDCRKRVTIYSSSQINQVSPLPVLYIERIKDGREDTVTVDMTTYDTAHIGDMYDPDTGKLSHAH